MKKIQTLRLEGLKLPEEMAFYYFVISAVAVYSIIAEMFANIYGKFKAAYDEQNDIYLRHDRKILTQIIQEKETLRDKWLRKLRNNIREITEFGSGEKLAAAEFLSTIIEEYGGAKIPDLTMESETGVLLNLYEDLQEKYPDKVEQLGLTPVVESAKQANDEFIAAQNARTQSDAEYGKNAMADARVKTARLYRFFVDSVNIEAETDATGALTPFIDYMNVKIDEMRKLAGQSPATGSGSDGDMEITLKTITFEFKNGNVQKFRLAVGAPIEVPANTDGYVWKPEVPAVMPKKNIVFREVPIEDVKATATFHFLDHREEEIRQIVGTLLKAPANTTGCIWQPAVPATMPAEDSAYYEMRENSEGGDGGNGSGSGNTGSGSGGGNTGSGSGNTNPTDPDDDPDALKPGDGGDDPDL